MLNGKLLKIFDNGTIPNLDYIDNGGDLVIQPYSANYFVYYNENNDNCIIPKDKTTIPTITVIIIVTVAIILGVVMISTKMYLTNKSRLEREYSQSLLLQSSH